MTTEEFIEQFPIGRTVRVRLSMGRKIYIGTIIAHDLRDGDAAEVECACGCQSTLGLFNAASLVDRR